MFAVSTFRAAARQARVLSPAARTGAVAVPALMGARSLGAAAQKDEEDVEESSSFARALFLGRINESQVFPYPQVLDPDQKDMLNMLVDPAERFFLEVNDAAQNDLDADIPPDTLQALKDLGAYGLQVPQEHDGLGLNNTQYARMTEVVGGNDLGVGITIGAHQSIGFKGILLVGNEEQKAKYLPKLATGEHVAAFALTEPTSGSDANSIRTRAKLSDDGKHFIINGSKIWISNGGTADVMTVFAQTEVDDPKNPGQKKDKVTAFIVERAFGGVTNGPPEKKMGIKASNTAEVYFEDVKVPIENVLGEVGGGFKVAMAILNNGRFGMGAALTGTMKSLISIAADHVNNRTQFGRTINEFGLVKEKMAEMALRCYAAESVAYLLSSNMDKGSTDYHIEAAISKVYASEAAWHVADDTLQLLGGLGFMQAYPVERIVRDLRIFRIFEGTNEILRLMIALTGMQSAGDHLKTLAKALKMPWKNTDLIMAEVPKRLNVALGGTNDKIKNAHPVLESSSKLIAKQTAAFGNVVETLLRKHGKNIIEQQVELRRVADCTIDLYTMAAVVSRCTQSLNNDLPSSVHEVALTTTYCERAAERISIQLEALKGTEDTDRMMHIGEEVCKNGAYIPSHPLDV